MNKLTCIESYIDQDQNHYGCFLIEPLEIGQGITLGNALRRTLLSDLSGFAITGVRINNLKHEFAIIEGLREDILEILLNLKELILKGSFFFKEKNSQEKLKGFLNIKGPIVVTAGMFNLPKNRVKILNPNQYICTLVDDSELYIEIDIENGKGYRLTEETKKQNLNEKFSPVKPSTLLIDAVFMPIKKVNYKVKLIHDTQGNIKESLHLEILTNGSITPKRAIQEALKVLMNLFYPLFVDPNFLVASSQLAKNFYN
jgi:DNA-directed RNA polymerase subunit alpha